MKEKQIMRQSNLELFRIILMLLIIGHHCSVHGGLLNINESVNYFIAYAFAPIGKIAFDAYLALSMWFLVNQTFRMKRFINTWFITGFYTLLFTIIYFLLSGNFTGGYLFASFLPMTGMSHGFASTYLAFYLLLPILTLVRKYINEKQNIYIILVLSLIEIVPYLWFPVSGIIQPLTSEVTFYVLCYFIMLYLKEHPVSIKNNKWVLFGIIVLVWGGILAMYLVLPHIQSQWVQILIGKILNVTAFEYSIPSIIAGYAWFFLVKDINIPQSKIINSIAKASFPVLLVHDHILFSGYLWTSIFKTQQWGYSKYFVIYFILTILSIYFIVYVIELLRSLMLKPLLDSKGLNKLCKKIDELVDLQQSV